MSYLNDINQTIDEVRAFLRKKGIQDQYLNFGGPIAAPVKKPSIPTDVRSEFLANRAMGDWAENSLAMALNLTGSGIYKTIHYGDSGNLSAGDPGFREKYLAGLEETRELGKRPDLLVAHANLKAEEDISGLPRKAADKIARQSIGAIEVRSSKQQALKYMGVKASENANVGKSGLSFTVKVEDLRIVYRWIEVCDVPQYYFQVFFDSVFAIDVLDIFTAIGKAKGISIDKPDKSQNKSTIMVPITNGVQVGVFNKPPRFEVAVRENRLGRIDPFVIPVGGELNLDDALIHKLLRIKG